MPGTGLDESLDPPKCARIHRNLVRAPPTSRPVELLERVDASGEESEELRTEEVLAFEAVSREVHPIAADTADEKAARLKGFIEVEEKGVRKHARVAVFELDGVGRGRLTAVAHRLMDALAYP
jgi:hypothetical protein